MRSNSDLAAISRILSDEIESFIHLKHFVSEIHGENNVEEIIKDLESVVECRKTLGDIYSALLVNDSYRAINFMGNYITVEKHMGKIDLSPIEAFLKQDNAIEIIKNIMPKFIDEICPAICEANLFGELKEIGLEIKILSIDSIYENEMITISIFNKELVYGLNANNTISRLIDVYILNKKSYPHPLHRDFIQSLEDYQELVACL